MEGHHRHNSPEQQRIGVVNVEGSDRFPQWSVEETKELVIMRAELDQKFMETKRNKLLWEVVATNMKEKGFNRSAEQCKCKWKNLITRYKGCETMEPDAVKQQFPFYDDLQAVFAARMERMLWVEAEGTSASKKTATGNLSSEEEDEIKDESEGQPGFKSNTRNTNLKKRKSVRSSNMGSSSSINNTLREVVEEFMREQIKIEREWREAWDAREKERAAREVEWRRRMLELENEREALERMWREREEQRRLREEARAEKRDALINALLDKVTRQNSI